MISFSFSLYGMQKTDEELLELASTTRGKKTPTHLEPYSGNCYIYRFDENEMRYSKLRTIQNFKEFLDLAVKLYGQDREDFKNKFWVLTRNFSIKKSRTTQELTQMGAIILGTNNPDAIDQLKLTYLYGKHLKKKDSHG